MSALQISNKLTFLQQEPASAVRGGSAHSAVTHALSKAADVYTSATG